MKPVGVKGLKAFDLDVDASIQGCDLIMMVQSKCPDQPITLICLGKNIDP